MRVDQFERDGTLRSEVRGAIDRTHPALSEELVDLVLVIEYIHASKLT